MMTIASCDYVIDGWGRCRHQSTANVLQSLCWVALLWCHMQLFTTRLVSVSDWPMFEKILSVCQQKVCIGCSLALTIPEVGRESQKLITSARSCSVIVCYVYCHLCILCSCTIVQYIWLLQQQQLFYSPLSGTTRVSWYQKKHWPSTILIMSQSLSVSSIYHDP